MKMRLLSLAAAAALLIVATPGPEARAAAAKLPMLQTETSDIVEVGKRYKRRAWKHRRSPRFYKHRYRRHYHYYPRRYHRRWRGPRFAIYVGSPRCSWLRRRAILTGSRYWWRRYYRCRYWW